MKNVLFIIAIELNNWQDKFTLENIKKLNYAKV